MWFNASMSPENAEVLQDLLEEVRRQRKEEDENRYVMGEVSVKCVCLFLLNCIFVYNFLSFMYLFIFIICGL